jgi:hypothetical protein
VAFKSPVARAWRGPAASCELDPPRPVSPSWTDVFRSNLSRTSKRISLDAHSLDAPPPALLSARRRETDPTAAIMTDAAARTPERVPAASSLPHHVRRVVTLPPKLPGPAAPAQVRDPETIEWLLHIEFARVVAFESSLSSSRPNSRSSNRAVSGSGGVQWSSPTETTLATGKIFRTVWQMATLWRLSVGHPRAIRDHLPLFVPGTDISRFAGNLPRIQHWRIIPPFWRLVPATHPKTITMLVR